MSVDGRNVETNKLYPTAIGHGRELYHCVEWDFQIGEVHWNEKNDRHMLQGEVCKR